MPRGYKKDGSFAGIVFKKGEHHGRPFIKGQPKSERAGKFKKGNKMGLGRKLSEERKIKMGIYKRGPENHNWKGGRLNNIKKRILDKAGRPKPDFCELCGRKDRRICFDHNHTTGKFRGWICNNCNLAIGYVREDIDILNKIIKYLQ